MNIKKIISRQLLVKAYVFDSEYAWKEGDIKELSKLLKQAEIAVLGGEVWIKSSEGPIIPSPNIYQWDSSEKKNNESWREYVDCTLKEMLTFSINLSEEKELSDRWSDVYINLEMIDQVGYLKLRKK